MLCVLLGGRVAEDIVFGSQSTGASNDLVRGTEIARRMVREWGMSDRIGPMAWRSSSTVSTVPSASTTLRGPPTRWPAAPSTRRSTSSPSRVSCCSSAWATASRPGAVLREQVAGAVLRRCAGSARPPRRSRGRSRRSSRGCARGPRRGTPRPASPRPSGRCGPTCPTPAPCGARSRCRATRSLLRRSTASRRRCPRPRGHRAAREHVLEEVLVVRVPLLLGQLLGHAQRHAGREDRDLVHRVGVLGDVGRDRRGRPRGTPCAPSPRRS